MLLFDVYLPAFEGAKRCSLADTWSRYTPSYIHIPGGRHIKHIKHITTTAVSRRSHCDFGAYPSIASIAARFSFVPLPYTSSLW